MKRAHTRRALLATVGSGITAMAAGCLGLSGSGGDGTPTAVEEPLPPARRGAADAPVTVSVYVDFACPHCRSFHRDVVPMIDDAYVSEGVAVYEHRDFPLPVDDPESYRAANAARAVQDTEGTEAFFEFASGLFDRQDELGLSLYETLASDVGAAQETVRRAANGRVYEATIERDRSTGQAAGVDSTPTVLVDGELFEGETWADLADRIEAARSA